MSMVRLDAYLVHHGLANSREKAKKMIQAGYVSIDGQRVTKAAAVVDLEQTHVTVTAPAERFVSRGGEKLDKALNVFSLSVENLFCLDIGASTGGFTDCMLQHGAAHVYAVDVGHGQLHPLLHDNPQVTSMEGINFRSLTPASFPRLFDFAAADVSFISLKLLFPVLFPLLAPGGKAVCLIKPQFEAGKSGVGKNGVVRSKAVHQRVLSEVLSSAAGCGFCVSGISFSPICGGDGNVEYLACFSKSEPVLSYERIPSLESIEDLVNQAHTMLQKK